MVTDPMRIAYVVSAFPMPFRTYIANEMTEIQKAGVEVVVVPLSCAQPSPVEQKALNSFEPAMVLPAPLFDLRVILDASLTVLTHPWRAFRTILGLHRAGGMSAFTQAALIAIVPKALATVWRLRKIKIDRIHAHFATHTTTCAGVVGEVMGIPFSFTAHAYDIYCRTSKLRNDTLKWKLSRAKQVFCVSRYGTKLLRRDLFPNNAEHVKTAYVGIPMDLFQEEAPTPRCSEIRLLCVTRFEEKKGLDTLIDACALLRDAGLPFRLSLYGGGRLGESLAHQIACLQLNDHVTLGGYLSQEQVSSEMKECHVFVMPCRQDKNGDMDGIPTVFMEAMASGRPVISCPISGIPELVRDGETGLLVPPNDPRSLAIAVKQIAEDDGLRVRLGKQARALVEKQHNQQRTSRRFLRLIIAANGDYSPAVQSD